MGDIVWGPLAYLLSSWGIVTAVLLVLVVYRVTLASREDDQIMISKAEEHMAAEQQEIVAKITRLSKPIFALTVASGLLLVAAAGVWLYQGLKSS